MNNENDNPTTILWENTAENRGCKKEKIMRVCEFLHCSCLSEYFPQVARIIPCTVETSPRLSRVRESLTMWQKYDFLIG